MSDQPQCEPPKSITYNDVATKLLSDKFLLTALELHTELVESGRELRQLKDFFSNPGNFEGLQTQELPLRISRSESQVTLDSLDLTRYSEDGAGTDERVAVLEFELRKAKETINALRNNLTVATESETSTPDKGSLRHLNIGTIKPHEQRALNFLINEYLLLHDYKLTSITFADENQHQDFDDWDDVGLNIARPPELLSLYRDGLKQCGQNSVSAVTQTDLDFKDDKIISLEEEIKALKSKIKSLEIDRQDLRTANANLVKENELISSQFDEVVVAPSQKSAPNSNKESLGSESPERFEMIDKNMMMPCFVVKKRDSIIIEDNISNSSFNTSDWTNILMNQESSNNERNSRTPSIKEGDINKEANNKLLNNNISKEPFKREVFSLCYVNIPQKVDNEILDNILNNSISNDSLVHTLSSSLLRIIPNIILNKREEAIPLLISAVHLNPNSKERDKLLQQLFNLKKKPSDIERTMILTGLVGIARFSGESLVENEILPQCWEQLTHKHVERRLLVAEACTALIPYVSSPIRNSLVLSMLQQMLDDREEIVRETVIRALALVVVLCDDVDKYPQCEELAVNTLDDSSSTIVNLSTQILFPILGKWALSNGRLSSGLLKLLLQKFNDCLKDAEVSSKSSDKILKIINVLENLLPFLLMSVACQDKILGNIEKDMAIELRPDFAKLCTNLTNPLKFYKSDLNVGTILHEFDKHIAESPGCSWPELDWVLDMLIPDLINNLNHIEITHHVLLQSFINLFSHICITFGRSFTRFKVRPILRTHVQSLEQIISNFNQYCPSLNVIPVYLVCVLTYCDEKDELSGILQRFLCALPLCGTPLDCLEVTVKRLCELELQELVVASLWEGVVHQRPLVRAATANLFSVIISNCDKTLLNFKVTPALVTLASDSDVLVRTAAIPALGTLITDCDVKEIHDKVYMQIQSYIADTGLRENHTLLRQLIVTMGSIVNSCTPVFRHDVILPQLTALSTYMMQMTNQTRKVDMALALVEAFTNVVYSPLSKTLSISSIVLPGLQCLENVVTENHSLMHHRDIVLSMMRECDHMRTDASYSSSSPQAPLQSPADGNKTNKLTQNVNQGVEEMRQRVSKMFNKPTIPKPNTLPNLQGIFKKKS